MYEDDEDDGWDDYAGPDGPEDSISEMERADLESVRSEADYCRNAVSWGRGLRARWYGTLEALADAMEARDSGEVDRLKADAAAEALDLAQAAAERNMGRDIDGLRAYIAEMRADGQTWEAIARQYTCTDDRDGTIARVREDGNGIDVEWYATARCVVGEYGVVVGDDYAWGSALATFLDSNT